MGTVLIVDDDREAIQSYARTLRLEGHTVFTADNAEDGLREAARHHPGAILLDLRMPLMDGLEFLQRLRGQEAQRSTQVAIVTGDYLIDDSIAADLQALGAEIKLKPLWLEDVVALARKLLAANEAAAHSTSSL
jgi:DNA-binding response OmpR family regulator